MSAYDVVEDTVSARHKVIVSEDQENNGQQKHLYKDSNYQNYY